jgi:hypothetical protein
MGGGAVETSPLQRRRRLEAVWPANASKAGIGAATVRTVREKREAAIESFLRIAGTGFVQHPPA